MVENPIKMDDLGGTLFLVTALMELIRLLQKITIPGPIGYPLGHDHISHPGKRKIILFPGGYILDVA